MTAPLGFVVGLAAEARIVRRVGAVAIGGGLPAGAGAAAEALVAQGVRILVSFGLAGGLDPALRPGDLVVPATVRTDETDFPTVDIFGIGTKGTLLAGTTIITTAVAKNAAFHRSGAASVDLESGAVAQVAQRHNLPFAVIRAVCDPAERDLPPAALAALDRQGGIGLWRVLASVGAHPGQVPGLIALARDAALARRALVRSAVQIRL